MEDDTYYITTNNDPIGPISSCAPETFDVYRGLPDLVPFMFRRDMCEPALPMLLLRDVSIHSKPGHSGLDPSRSALRTVDTFTASRLSTYGVELAVTPPLLHQCSFAA